MSDVERRERLKSAGKGFWTVVVLPVLTATGVLGVIAERVLSGDSPNSDTTTTTTTTTEPAGELQPTDTVDVGPNLPDVVDDDDVQRTTSTTAPTTSTTVTSTTTTTTIASTTSSVEEVTTTTVAATVP